MSKQDKQLTHVAGTFLIQANGAFLNGAGLGDGEDRNVTIPKTFRDVKGTVPYVSAQAWKRWLRTTAIQEEGWPASESQAIGWNPKGNVNKIAGQLNPVEFPEDDIFGYMRAQEGQGRRKATEEDEEDEDETSAKTKAVMRASPFAASLLVSLRSSDWKGEDEGFVHLRRYDPRALAEAEIERFLGAVSEVRQDKKKDIWKRLEPFAKDWVSSVKSACEAPDLQELRRLLAAKAQETSKEVAFIENATSPLPYTTRFYNTHLQGVFCLDYSRLGVFWNVGDRIELEEEKAKRFLKDKLEDVTTLDEYKALTQGGKAGRVYRLKDLANDRKRRATGLLKALALLRGGAKQAQFGTDIAPKVLILAGLSCGNPILNHLFKDDGEGPVFKIKTFKEVISDYADRIAVPVLLGIRAGYVKNEDEITTQTKDGRRLLKEFPVEVEVTTPVQAAKRMGELLP